MNRQMNMPIYKIHEGRLLKLVKNSNNRGDKTGDTLKRQLGLSRAITSREDVVLDSHQNLKTISNKPSNGRAFKTNEDEASKLEKISKIKKRNDSSDSGSDPLEHDDSNHGIYSEEVVLDADKVDKPISHRRTVKTHEDRVWKFENSSKSENKNNDWGEKGDPLEHGLDSSDGIFYTEEAILESYQDDSVDNTAIDDDKYENTKSKDDILRETMYNIVVSNNVSNEVTESFLKMLSVYGINVPTSKDELVAEFQKTNDSTISRQYNELKRKMAKMEATLEQIKNAILNPRLAIHDLCVTIPVESERDLELLNLQCAENDMTIHFEKFKHLNDVIDDSLLLHFNWDGVQGKNKLSQYRNLHQTLFGAFKNNEITDFSSYEQFAKRELRRINNKHHQKLSRKRRSENSYAKVEHVYTDEILS